MKIGIVVDAACDLPQKFINRHEIAILPIKLLMAGKKFLDARNPSVTRSFYRTYLTEKDLDAETQAIATDAVRDFFLNNLVKRYDRVLVICMSRTRGLVYDNATEASYAILQECRKQRAAAGLEGSFAMRVIDSQTLFSGQALLAHEAVRMIEGEKARFKEVRQAVEGMRQHIHSYLIPQDLFYMRNRARMKGDKSIDLFSYHVGRMLNIKPTIHMHRGESVTAAKHRGFDLALKALFERIRGAMRAGLISPVITMSYAGDPLVIQEKQVYKDFASMAAAKNVKLLFAIMSATAGVNVGPGAFSLSYAGTY